MGDTLFKRLSERLHSPFPTSLNRGAAATNDRPFSFEAPGGQGAQAYEYHPYAELAQRRPAGWHGHLKSEQFLREP